MKLKKTLPKPRSENSCTYHVHPFFAVIWIACRMYLLHFVAYSPLTRRRFCGPPLIGISCPTRAPSTRFRQRCHGRNGFFGPRKTSLGAALFSTWQALAPSRTQFYMRMVHKIRYHTIIRYVVFLKQQLLLLLLLYIIVMIIIIITITLLLCIFYARWWENYWKYTLLYVSWKEDTTPLQSVLAV